jgi:type IV secretion system protein VirB2
MKTLRSFVPAAVIGLVVLTAGAASAATSGTVPTGSVVVLPWETALGNLASGLTGNTAKIISIIAIFIAGIALILGEDLGQFARRLLMIVIAVAFLVGAASFIAPFTAGAGI